MKMHHCPASVFALLSLVASGVRTTAAELMAEGFDAQATAHVEVNNGLDATATFVDYSNMIVGTTTHNIPEAPRRVTGSAATRGVLLKMSYGGVNANERIANLVALDDVGGTRLALTDNYRLRFDVYLRISPTVTPGASGVPTQAGTTEDMIWNVGYQALTGVPMGRLFRSSRGTGVWGLLATEGGYGSTTSGGDAGIWLANTTNAAGTRHLETAADRAAFFTPAFGSDATPVPNCPANQWVEADISVSAGLVTVEFGAVGRTKTKFHENVAGGTVAGGAMVGYEDTFTSASFAPDEQWMLVDNMVVEDISPPTLVVTPSIVKPLKTFTGTPVTAEYTIQNTRLAGDLTITAVNFTGTGAADFALMTPMPLVVGPNASQPLEIVFNPAAPNGIKTATMTFVSNDPQAPSHTMTLRARRSVGSFLQAHYKLDETSGTALTDSTGNGVNAALTVRDPVLFGQPTLLGGTDTGTALGFTPAQSSVTGNYFTTPVVHTPSFSLSLWIKPAATTWQRTLFQRDYDSLAPYDKIYGLHLASDGSLLWRVRAGAVIPAVGDPALPLIPDGELHHVVLTHSDEDGFGNETATRTRLYLDGVRIAEKTGADAKGFDDYPLNPVVANMHVASRTIAGFGYSGDMDDVQIYGAELTREQVWHLFKAAGTTAPPVWSVQDVVKDGNGITLTCPTAAGGVYKLFRSGDLQIWTQVGDPVTATAAGLTTLFADPAPPAGRQYYRVTRE